MKTEIEVQEYLKDKVYSSEEAIFIIGFLCGKRLKPIIVCSSYSPTNSSEEFLDWFESETKTFEDKPKDILVPESIKITDCKTDGYTLGLLFNNDIQILTYGKKRKAYLVGIKGLNAKYIQCKLVPTLFSEIKAGDIYIECGLNQLNPSCYHIKLYGKEYAKIYGKKDIQVCLDLPDKNQNVYKVVPVI